MKSYRSGSGVNDTRPTDAYYTSLRPEMAELLPETATRVLDVGCGSGSFAHSLKSRSSVEEIWGIEINPKVANQAGQFLDRVLIGDIVDLFHELPPNYFDAVYFNDVLEHMIDPYTVIEKIKSHLAPNASILVSLPNVRYIRNIFDLMVSKDWAYKDSGVLDRTHLRFFTQKSAIRMFEEAGYSIKLVRGIESTKKWYMPILNLFTAGYFEDTFYLQYIFRLQLVNNS